MQNNGITLREMLMQMPTDQLDTMLQSELKKQEPDAPIVRLILDILEDREPEASMEMDEQTARAWERYQARLAAEKGKQKPAKRLHLRWLLTTAAVLVLVMTFIIPQQASAETFREMLTRWKQDILEFISPDERVEPSTVTFQTDNEGLQQLYDMAVEHEIDSPLIPMWLDDYKLSDCKVGETLSGKCIIARFTNDNSASVFRVDIYSEEEFHGFYGDDTYYEAFEKDGAKYEITRNGDRWVVVWKKDKVEYFLTMDCQEDTLRRMLASIYVMEE